ncbi:hypothetical protein AgCh_001782 [Apium graveolens]
MNGVLALGKIPFKGILLKLQKARDKQKEWVPIKQESSNKGKLGNHTSSESAKEINDNGVGEEYVLQRMQEKINEEIIKECYQGVLEETDQPYSALEISELMGNLEMNKTVTRALDSNKFLIIFLSKEDYLNRDRELLGVVFIRVKDVELSDLLVLRKVWVEIKGLPLYAWNIEKNSEILQGWGKVIQTARIMDDNFSFINPRCLIETGMVEKILGKIMISLNGSDFDIQVDECGKVEYMEEAQGDLLDSLIIYRNMGEKEDQNQEAREKQSKEEPKNFTQEGSTEVAGSRRSEMVHNEKGLVVETSLVCTDKEQVRPKSLNSSNSRQKPSKEEHNQNTMTTDARSIQESTGSKNQDMWNIREEESKSSDTLATEVREQSSIQINNKGLSQIEHNSQDSILQTLKAVKIRKRPGRPRKNDKIREVNFSSLPKRLTRKKKRQVESPQMVQLRDIPIEIEAQEILEVGRMMGLIEVGDDEDVLRKIRDNLQG